jgi:hypothetical protein
VVARDESPNSRFLYAQSIAERVHRKNTSELLTSIAAVLHLVEKQTHHYLFVTVEITMFATSLDICYSLLCFFQKKKKMDSKLFSWKLRRKH